MLCCSCCSYKETYANDNLYWTQNWNTNVLDKLNEILQEQRDSQNNVSNFLQKILDKLNYVAGYKKLYNYNEDKRIVQIENITESNDIIEELNILGLAILYKNEIKDLEDDKIDNLDKYKNIIKTKYLIDNEVITASIDDRAYKEVEFKPPSPDPKYPKDTNELYYNENIVPILDKELGSKTTNILIELKTTEIESRKSMQPEIYIMDDGEIDKNVDNQIYLNNKFKKKFKQSVDEYNIEFTNTNILKAKVKEDFESGFYLGDGSYNIKRADYENEFGINQS
tara:strand:+ start:8075 stop:8920 length:846 start_codon:yes stop_codon:yes gene_type:complete